MRMPEEVLIRPLLTEKMLAQQEERNRYGFVVARDANKIEIRQAIEVKFDVKVEDVRTIVVKGKSKQMNTRRGLTSGKRPTWKKAIVTLSSEDEIDFFESTV